MLSQCVNPSAPAVALSQCPSPVMPRQPSSTASNIIEQYKLNQNVFHSQKLLKRWRLMIFLAAIESVLATIMVLLGSVCISWGYGSSHGNVCSDSTAVWVGLLCVINAFVGLSAVCLPTGKRCVMIVYFALSIITIIFCLVLTVVSHLWSRFIYMKHDITNITDDISLHFLVLLIFNLTLTFVSILHSK